MKTHNLTVGEIITELGDSVLLDTFAGFLI